MRASRYLDELIDYGGLAATRAEAVLDMQAQGASQGMIDRWLQGYDLGVRIRSRHARLTTRVFLVEPARRTRKLAR